MTFREQLRQAVRGAWLVISVAVFFVAAAPFLLSERAIDSLVPVCEWKARYGRECPMCGMTHAFLLISRGRFGEASARNRASLPLYAAMLLNECAATVAGYHLLRRRLYVTSQRGMHAASGE